MTLRDKLKPTTSINTQGEAGRFADKSVKVAEEFAIGFAEWFIDSEGKPKGEWSIKELLEIYKKTL